MVRINQSAATSGMALCAMSLLSAKKSAMSRDDLIRAVDDNLTLLKAAPFSDMVSLPDLSGKEIVENTLKLGKISVSNDSFGEILSLERRNAVTLTYYRNNILHLFALPGLIAAIVFASKGKEKAQILDLVDMLYPLLQREWFLYMDKEQARAYADKLIGAMKEMGMLRQQGKKIVPADPTEPTFYSVWLLNRSIQETLHRYAVVLTLLAKEGTVSRGALEKQSRLYSERLAALHGISSPEFYDKNVLATFINAMRDNDLVSAADNGQLQHSETTEQLRQEVIGLIAPEVAQRLQKFAAVKD